MELRILELFSGIGGMHYAFKYSQLPGTVVAAMDINTVANAVYDHNHSATPVTNGNIQRLNAKTLDKLRVNTLVMSPPCQPHTRVGNQLDEADNRSDALRHICQLLPQCNGLQYVLMENVKGFESSQARQNFVQALRASGFFWRELILSPTQFGVPNTRHRYYCVARKGKDFAFSDEPIWQVMPDPSHMCQSSRGSIEALLESEVSISTDFRLPENVLSKRIWLMDIVTPAACNTMCFTKAYTHYSEGTGSVFTPLGEQEMKNIFEEVKRLEVEEEQEPEEGKKQQLALKRLALLGELHLRYFTPREVARLMSFPEDFNFPTATKNRQKYRLLGNSLNVRVVGELMKLMCHGNG